MAEAINGAHCRLLINGHDVSKHVRSVQVDVSTAAAVMMRIEFFILPRIEGKVFHVDLGIPPPLVSAVDGTDDRPVTV